MMADIILIYIRRYYRYNIFNPIGIMRNKFLLGAIITTSLFANAEKDPVLMTINGKDVKLSEFEYLYNKNNKQQIEKETLDEYVDRFVVYKLKVADAEAAGIDTTASFKKEYEGYKNDLAKPYLNNNKYAIPFAKEAYERLKKNVHVSHIMLPLMHDDENQDPNKIKMDSIRNRILNGEDFGELAEKFSSDGYSARKKGDLGFAWAGRYPYPFEFATYNTPVGEISPVVRTQYGYHIIKVTDEHPTYGKYQVAHLLKFYPRNASDSAKAVVDAKMDSIYRVLKSGADFTEVVKVESEDGRTSKRGGELGWLGRDQLLPELEKIMLNTPVGDVSTPYKADYGVHIIKTVAHKPMESYEELEKDLLEQVNRDERAEVIRNAKLNDLKAEYKYAVDKNFEKVVSDLLTTAGGYDSTVYDKLNNDKLVAFSFAGGKVYASEIVSKMNRKMKLKDAAGKKYVDDRLNQVANAKIFDYEKESLSEKYPEYANLLNEYREGMLLFEISNRNVWDKAGKDKEGLEKYFEKNKSKYTTWKEPRFKGLVVFSMNDSIENEVKKELQNLGGDTIATALHKKFKRDIKIERHLTAKGENAKIDELAFGGAKADTGNKYTTCFILDGKVINQPEEASDVRGQVTTDYQNVLEKAWVDKLKSGMSLKINKKVMKKVK